MISLLLNTSVGGIYAGGMAYLMQASNLDQRIFEFVAPKFQHACGLGVVYALTEMTLKAVIRTFTGTTFSEQNMMYIGSYTEMDSEYPKIYEICATISPIISAFSATYLLRQMNYSIPYRFTAVCLIPWVLANVVRSLENDFN